MSFLHSTGNSSRRRRLLLGAFVLLLGGLGRGGAPVPAAAAPFVPTAATAPALHQDLPPRSTLLVYNTVQGLLAGDLLHIVTIGRVQADMMAFPPGWPVDGVGTTNTAGRTGELIPDGTAGDLHFWWADPNSPSQAQIYDLRDNNPGNGALFPFIALAVGDPDSSFSWTLDNVDDVHAWLNQQLAAAGIELAGVQLRGRFGQVKTSVSYNLPLTGLDLSGGYVGDAYFRFGDYTPATWTMDGIYAAAPALQPVISTAGNPLHLHGYQPAAMVGGHITAAAAISVTATIWPLDQLVVRRGSLNVGK